MIAEIARWEFAWPWLWLVLPLPLLALLASAPVRQGLGAALRIPFGQDLRAVLRDSARIVSRPRMPWLALLAWIALCAAAARPQILGEVVQPPHSGRDLLLVVDLSGSMAEQDMSIGGRTVNRLTAVKAVVGDFLDRRIGDRVGLLLFGQRAYAVTPLTLDRNSVREQLLDSTVGIAGRETAIGDALGLAVKRLSESAQEEAESADASAPRGEIARGQQVVILLTDGVNTAGMLTPEKAAGLARARGVRVHAIGFGGEGASRFLGMRLPQAAEIDERSLQSVAQQTGGRYFRARDTRELAGIYAEIDRIEPVARRGEVQRPRIERYPLPLAAALALAALALLMRRLPVRTAVGR